MKTTLKRKTVIPHGKRLEKSVQSKSWRKTFKQLLSKMPENVRRWNAALLGMQLGYGGMKIAGEISGLSQPTLHKARQELERGQVDWDCDRQRKPGGGRKLIEQTQPGIVEDLKKLVADETAGNPSSGDCWVDRTSRKLADEMRKVGHKVSHVTVIRLLKKEDWA